MSLKERLSEEIKKAMKSRDAERLSVLRLISAAVKQQEVDRRITIDDAGLLEILNRQIKQRRDSIEQFDKGGRADLSAKERQELDIISEFMPAAATDAEVDESIVKAIAETGATKMNDMGKVMELLKTKLANRTDMARLAALVRQKLN